MKSWNDGAEPPSHEERSMGQQPVDLDVLDAQREHWEQTFVANPSMYGTEPSEAGRHALQLFTAAGAGHVLELGAGQGRDTRAFLAAGLRVTALDYSPRGLEELTRAAEDAGCADRLRTAVHDVRRPLPLADASVDGVFSHMLFTMALTTEEILALAGEVRRVLRPGGWHVYTVRHVATRTTAPAPPAATA
jgi:SAM-dependent methyltransferase